MREWGACRNLTVVKVPTDTCSRCSTRYSLLTEKPPFKQHCHGKSGGESWQITLALCYLTNKKSNQGVSNLCKAERADLHKGMVGPLCFQTSQPPEFCDWRCRRSTCSVSATSEQHILWQSLKTRPHSSQPWETTGPLFGKRRALNWWQLYLSYSQQA